MLIMDRAYEKTKNFGSATIILGCLNRDEISFANLGDSGFRIFRFKDDEPTTESYSNE